MQCRSVLTRVDALRTGELHPVERGVLNDHLRTCRSCEESVDDVSLLAGVVKSLAVTSPRSCRESIRCSDSFDRLDDVWVAYSRLGLRMIHRGGSESDFRAAYTSRYGRELDRSEMPASIRRQLTGALSGEGTNKPVIDIEPGELEGEVMSALLRIPRGEVRTYSWLAEQVGRPRAVRAIASFVARNIVPFVVPCHRVVPISGGVGKYAFGTEVKRDLLRSEGVDVDGLDSLAREGTRFVGSRTTNIVCFPTCRDAKRIQEKNRVPFRAADEAVKKGFRPCKRCQPFAA